METKKAGASLPRLTRYLNTSNEKEIDMVGEEERKTKEPHSERVQLYKLLVVRPYWSLRSACAMLAPCLIHWRW